MDKIDRRHIYGIMLDTETANTIQEPDGLNMNNVLPYDLGFMVIDSHGRKYGEAYSFIISDIFEKENDLMRSAYYAKKIPQYLEDLANGSRKMVTAKEAYKVFHEVYNRYNCKFVCAHNMRFDLTALNNIMRWTTKSRFRYFLPYGCELWDTMKMAQSVICKMPTYKKFCADNGYLTKNGQVRKTAEILYRFISGQHEFEESHTGLEDVNIEAEILAYCVRQHKSMNRHLFNNQRKPETSTAFQQELKNNLKNFPVI